MIVTSVVDICNLALSNIRAGSITSIDEVSIQAQTCKLKYPIIRDKLLTSISWGFNRTIAPLAVVTTEIFTWAYAYQYPTNCKRIIRLVGAHEELANADADVVSRIIDSQILAINDIRNAIPYEVFNFSGNKVIGANEGELRIDFVTNNTNPDLFTAGFILGFSHLLAAELAVPLVGGEEGRALRKDSLVMYDSYMSEAITDDANEEQQDVPESEFVTIRR